MAQEEETRAGREQDHAQGQEKRCGPVLAVVEPPTKVISPSSACVVTDVPLRVGPCLLSLSLEILKTIHGSISQKWVMGHVEHTRYKV